MFRNDFAVHRGIERQIESLPQKPSLQQSRQQTDGVSGCIVAVHQQIVADLNCSSQAFTFRIDRFKLVAVVANDRTLVHADRCEFPFCISGSSCCSETRLRPSSKIQQVEFDSSNTDRTPTRLQRGPCSDPCTDRNLFRDQVSRDVRLLLWRHTSHHRIGLG